MPLDETETRREARGSISALFGKGNLPPPRFDFAFVGRRGDCEEGWRVRGFELEERTDAPYRLSLDLVAPDGDWELGGLVHRRGELEIRRGDTLRSVLGVVTSAEYRGAAARGHRVRLVLGPAISLLANTRRSRIFQDRLPIEIAQRVIAPMLGTYGGRLDMSLVSRGYTPRDFCVQYDETDLDFLLRILAEAGINILFDHTGAAETTVLCDDNRVLPMAGAEPLERADSGPPMIPRWHGDPRTIVAESVSEAKEQVQTGARTWSAHGWDWKSKPPAAVVSTIGRRNEVAAVGEVVVDDVGRLSEGQLSDGPIVDSTAVCARRQAEIDCATGRRLLARSNATVLRAGSVFELVAQSLDRFGQQWIVTAIRHRGDAPQAELREGAPAAASTFTNTMECQPRSAAVRPRQRPKPRVVGTTTAVVTGPKGEAIHTDEHGRVRVRMHWDHAQRPDEPSSCWLRVVQPWAGEGHGATFIPRVGSEVLVSFVDGDPDRPICWGGLHNGLAHPTHALPDNRTSTVIRTRHVADTDGYHELRFEDGAGEEAVHLHAGGRFSERVQGPHSTTVAGARTLTVAGRRTATFRTGSTVEVEGPDARNVNGPVRHDFLGGVDIHVSEAPQPDDTPGFRTSVGRGLYEVNSTEGIVLRCGECSIELRPDTITLAGPNIVLNSDEDGNATLSLAAGHAEVVADDVLMRSGAAALQLDGIQASLSQGSAGTDQALIALKGGDAHIQADAMASVRAATCSTTVTDDVSVDAGSVTIASSGDATVTAVQRATVSASGDLVLNGGLVRIN